MRVRNSRKSTAGKLSTPFASCTVTAGLWWKKRSDEAGTGIGIDRARILVFAAGKAPVARAELNTNHQD